MAELHENCASTAPAGRRKKIDEVTLLRWRATIATDVLVRIADYAKSDPTFTPAGPAAPCGSKASRWYACAAGVEYELILQGPKFWDGRAGRGGCGAVDLAMHLFEDDFRTASARLFRAGV